VAKRVRYCVCAIACRGLISAESISRQLRAWADATQNSDIRGQRYLTNKARVVTKEARERAEFLKELENLKRRGK
jgi:hypothetical protein